MNYREGRDNRSVYREHDIVQLDWIKSAWESIEVLVLDVSDPIKRAVENRVQRVTKQVEGEKVEVQSDHGFSLIVVPDLRVEGD